MGVDQCLSQCAIITSALCLSLLIFLQHAQRVLRILKLEDLVDGVVYCDYEVKDFVCKPEATFYHAVYFSLPFSLSGSLKRSPSQAMEKADISDPSKCYFVDDSRSNVDGARAQGWARCVHFSEHGLEAVEGGVLKKINNEKAAGAEPTDGIDTISDLEELRVVWPEIFKDL